MAPSSVRFFSFPWLVQEEILRNMGLPELVLLYQLSKRASRAIIHTKLASSKVELHFKKDYTDEVIVWYKGSVHNFSLVEITGDEGNVEEVKEKRLIYHRHKNEIDNDCLQPMFSILRKPSIDSFRFSRNLYESEFSKYSNTIFEAKELRVSTGVTDKAELNLVFKKFKNLDTFFSEATLPVNYKRFRCRKFKKFQTSNFDSLEMRDAVKIDAEYMFIEKKVWTGLEVNAFIRFWLNENSRLKEVTFNIDVEDEIEIKDVHAMYWCWRRRSRYFVSESSMLGSSVVDCEDGLDFERRDGLLATLIEIGDGFAFLVWHERFPELPKSFFSEQ